MLYMKQKSGHKAAFFTIAGAEAPMYRRSVPSPPFSRQSFSAFSDTLDENVPRFFVVTV